MDYIEGLKALICGLSTVFIVLIIISLVISLFKFIKTDKMNTSVESENIIETESVDKTAEIPEKGQDDLELIAVITAAIAASMNTTTDKLKVTSFRKIKSRRG